MRNTIGVNKNAIVRIFTGLRGAERGEDEQAHEDHGDRQHRFHDAADDLVGDAADVAADEAEQGADDDAEQGRERRHEQDVACACHDPREHVAPELVGAERVGAARGLARRETGLERPVRAHPLAADGADHPEQQHDGPDDETRPAAQQPPPLAARQAAFGRGPGARRHRRRRRRQRRGRAHRLTSSRARGFIHASTRSAASVDSMYTVATTSTPATSTGGSFDAALKIVRPRPG